MMIFKPSDRLTVGHFVRCLYDTEDARVGDCGIVQHISGQGALVVLMPDGREIALECWQVQRVRSGDGLLRQ